LTVCTAGMQTGGSQPAENVVSAWWHAADR
jgi:hypothetical protein